MHALRRCAIAMREEENEAEAESHALERQAALIKFVSSMGRSKEKQAREEAESRALKEHKKDSGSSAAEAADKDQVSSAPSKEKKLEKRSKDVEGTEQELDESHAASKPAAAVHDADIEGIEKRRAREEAKREKEEKKGGLARI